jgi:hypothetical protein
MSFFKNGEQEGKTGPLRGLGTSGRGEDVRKECGRENVVERSCTRMKIEK